MIYFDHASGSPPDAAVADFLRNALLEHACNQEALHAEALTVRRALDEAAVELARLAGFPEYRVVWGSSATGLFKVLAGYLERRRGRVLAARLNHPALDMALTSTLDTAYVQTLRTGLNPEALAALTAEPPLALVLPQVESELGLRFDLDGARQFLCENTPDTLFFSDAVQAFGKEPLQRADAIVLSGHKIGAPGAAALLFDPARLPRMGEFASALRQKAHYLERPEPAFLLTLVFAAKRRIADMTGNAVRVSAMNALLRKELSKIRTNDGQVTDFPVAEKDASPYILAARFPGHQSAILLRMLSQSGICVGAGAACMAESGEASRALTHFGYRGEEVRGALRISFAPSSTLEECRVLAAALAAAVAAY